MCVHVASFEDQSSQQSSNIWYLFKEAHCLKSDTNPENGAKGP